MTKLTDPIYSDEEAARLHFERIRWPNGRACPHCGTLDNSVLLKGKSTRPGLYKCRSCRKPFSATIGTVYRALAHPACTNGFLLPSSWCLAARKV